MTFADEFGWAFGLPSVPPPRCGSLSPTGEGRSCTKYLHVDSVHQCTLANGDVVTWITNASEEPS